MNQITIALDHPVIRYMVIAFASAIFAAMFWLIGEDVAEAVGADPTNNIRFRLGGALAGFVVVLVLSFAALRSLDRSPNVPRRVKVFLLPRDQFGGDTYTCIVRAYDSKAGRSERCLPARVSRLDISRWTCAASEISNDFRWS